MCVGFGHSLAIGPSFLTCSDHLTRDILAWVEASVHVEFGLARHTCTSALIQDRSIAVWDIKEQAPSIAEQNPWFLLAALGIIAKIGWVAIA